MLVCFQVNSHEAREYKFCWLLESVKIPLNRLYIYALAFLCKRNHATFTLVCLIYVTWLYGLKEHTLFYRGLKFIILNGWVVPQCACKTFLSFIWWWTYRWLPPFSCCKLCCLGLGTRVSLSWDPNSFRKVPPSGIAEHIELLVLAFWGIPTLISVVGF